MFGEFRREFITANPRGRGRRVCAQRHAHCTPWLNFLPVLRLRQSVNLPLELSTSPLSSYRIQKSNPFEDSFPNRSNALRSSSCLVSYRAPRSRQNRLVVESPLIEDVFVCCTRFLRMYFHRVSSRHWPSPLTPPRCCEDHARLVADKLANGKEPKERGCAIAIAIMGFVFHRNRRLRCVGRLQ